MVSLRVSLFACGVRVLRTAFILAVVLATGPMAFAGWVAVGEKGTVVSSADGINWSAAIIDPAETLRGVGFDGISTWVAAGQSGTIVTSQDVQNWGQQTSGSTEPLWGTVFQGGQWIVSGSNGRILTSPDGVTWTSVLSGFSFILYDIAYNQSNLYTAVGDSGIATKILTSPDGGTWTQETPTPNIGEGLYGIAYDGATWVAVGDKGKILSSSDPSTRSWTEQPSGTETDLRDIVYNGTGLYIAVGREGTILTSTDAAATWQPVNSGTPFDLWGVAYDGSGQYIAVGEEGVILTSADGVSWSAQESQTFRVLYDIALAKLPQTINFPPQVPFFQSFVDGGSYLLNPEATASSGLTVTYKSLTQDVCSANDTTITMIALGECQIEASQLGDDSYLPAVPVIQSVLHITTPPDTGVPSNPGLLFDPQESELFSAGNTFVLSPAATTSLTPFDPQPVIVYASRTPSVCTIPLQGSLEVTMLAVGDCTIAAASVPNTLYSVGAPVDGVINIYALAEEAEPIPTMPQPLLWLLSLLAMAVASSRLPKTSRKPNM